MKWEQELPQEIEGYKIVKKLGRGGMGSVYLVEKAQKQRAMKVFFLEKGNREFAVRFSLEAKALGRLSHPNIIKVLDVGKIDNLMFFTMEYASEGDLFERLKNTPKLKEKEALHIAFQVSKALQHAHRHKLIHRDIKPENILLEKNDHVKLTDWGVAKALDANFKLTQDGVACGTPEYMSPEQIRGESLTFHTDIYSLGITLYQMLTGAPPFSGEDQRDVMQKHLTGTFVSPRKRNPKISPGAEQLVVKMLNKVPKKRFKTPMEMVKAIKSVQISGTMPETGFMRFIGFWKNIGKKKAPRKRKRKR